METFDFNELLYLVISALSVGFMGLMSVIVWFIKRELTFISDSLKRSHKNYHNLYTWMVTQSSRCNLLHPKETPLQPPVWEE